MDPAAEADERGAAPARRVQSQNVKSLQELCLDQLSEEQFLFLARHPGFKNFVEADIDAVRKNHHFTLDLNSEDVHAVAQQLKSYQDKAWSLTVSNYRHDFFMAVLEELDATFRFTNLRSLEVYNHRVERRIDGESLQDFARLFLDKTTGLKSLTLDSMIATEEAAAVLASQASLASLVPFTYSFSVVLGNLIMLSINLILNYSICIKDFFICNRISIINSFF